MTLRARLLLAFATILAVTSVGVLVILQTQDSYLTDRLDDQLRASRPLFRLPPGNVDRTFPTGLSGPEEPISALYVGILESGQLVTILEGQLLEDRPDIGPDDLLAISDGSDAPRPVTVDGVDGNSRFRVLLVRPAGTDIVSVIALPLDEVEKAVDRLRVALVGGMLAIAAVLCLAAWWVERLGLRPVRRVTEVADAIASGDRSARVDELDPRTEAGRLATAFNVMLDERDADEARLRRFVADASHELRTPLTSIRGYLDLYREGGFRSPGALDDVVRRMSQESIRMHELVEDLLLLARLDEHRPLRRELVDLGPLLRDAVTDALVLQPDRQVGLDLTAEPLQVLGDSFRLQQVVGVLVSNALVHTPPEAGLWVSARRTADGAQFTIRDTGPGLAPDDAARIFDRFYRGDRSRARATGGSGLGLAIAKSVVEAHGGTIRLETAPGSGCAFIVELPDAPGDPPVVANS